MNKNKKNLKKVIILFIVATILTGCTSTLKDKNGKPIINEVTGQSMTENILCRPGDKETLKIYEENGVKVEELEECSKMKLTSTYESLWTSFFVRPLSFVIVKLGSLLNSTTLAIIAITLIIRILLYPVTKKAALQSENIKKAQPELNRIEKKYEGKTDTDSINKKGAEMLGIYKKYEINPLTGCIFSLIQLPLLFAFLEAINRVPAIFEETYFHFQMGTTPWVAITNGQYYYIIINIVIIASTYFSFKMSASQTNNNEENLMAKQQKMMTILMVVLIGFMSFSLPTAIAVYWITSSLFTIVQNWFVARKMKHE